MRNGRFCLKVRRAPNRGSVPVREGLAISGAFLAAYSVPTSTFERAIIVDITLCYRQQVLDNNDDSCTAWTLLQ